jgi:Tfp pilus assembly protein PilN
VAAVLVLAIVFLFFQQEQKNEVLDFTHFSEQEITNYLLNHENISESEILHFLDEQQTKNQTHFQVDQKLRQECQNQHFGGGNLRWYR